MSSPSAETSASISDGLELDSLDSQSLFMALTNVEKAIPELLLSVKPILSHLVSPTENGGMDEETSGILAREGVERYMSLLDKIQFILRQTVYYLHATKISNEILNPPMLGNIPTPFATTLPTSSSPPTASAPQQALSTEGREVELGLYSQRIEEKVLGDIVRSLKALRKENGEKDDDNSHQTGR